MAGRRVAIWAQALALALALARAGGAAESPPTTRESVLRNYAIGPGDLLEISVFELEELSRTVRVSADGTISYPMVGVVEVRGLTALELEQRLAEMLAQKYIRDPQVSVFLREMQSGTVAVLGAVGQPGGITLIAQGTVLEALSRAGGVTNDAGSRAYLIRGTASEPVTIDLRRLMEEADLALNYPVGAGDVLYVPKVRRYKVYVYGQVEKPGAFEVEEGQPITVLQAVSMAGGMARRASAGKIKVVRGSQGEGKQKLFKVNLSSVISGKAKDFVLLEGDIVVVPKSFF